jgi:hypothetical protein
MAHIHFEEEQRFTNVAWIWIASLLLVLVPVGISVADPDTTSENLTVMLLSIPLGLLPVIGILLYSKLLVQINGEGLRYKFFPTVYRWKVITGNEIESFEVTPGKNFLEKVEMGHKRNLLNNSIAMNITGKSFARIKLKDGRKLKIGTNNPEEFKRALQKLTSPDNS